MDFAAGGIISDPRSSTEGIRTPGWVVNAWHMRGRSGVNNSVSTSSTAPVHITPLIPGSSPKEHT
jgi:hypothetical protein